MVRDQKTLDLTMSIKVSNMMGFIPKLQMGLQVRTYSCVYAEALASRLICANACVLWQASDFTNKVIILRAKRQVSDPTLAPKWVQDLNIIDFLDCHFSPPMHLCWYSWLCDCATKKTVVFDISRRNRKFFIWLNKLNRGLSWDKASPNLWSACSVKYFLLGN